MEEEMKKKEIGYEHFFPDVPPDWETYFTRHLESVLLRNGITKRNRVPVPNDDSEKLAELFANEKPEYKGKIVVSPKPIIKNKDFDIISLLSTNENGNENENYLVRSSNGEKVRVDSLKGKYVLVCCFLVPMYWSQHYVGWARDISLASFEMECRDNFEVVVVPKMRPKWANDKRAFDRFVSGFSCLTVPFHHSMRRDYICQSLKFQHEPSVILVDPRHKVLQDDVDFIRNIGAVDAFPFNDEKVDHILYSFDEGWIGQSLERILGCDTLKKNPGGGTEEMRVSELKDKVVGLYLCSEGYDILVLDRVYQECKLAGLPFEIVLVYTTYYSDKPLNLMQTLINGALQKHNVSWWVLPYNNSICRRLCRMSYYAHEDQLVIIGRNFEFVDISGIPLIRSLGINAYPFSKESVLQKEVERKREFRLDSFLLAEGSQGYVCRSNNDFDRVPVTGLMGKHIILFLCSFKDPHPGLSLDVINWYQKVKSIRSDFDMVLFNIDIEPSKCENKFLSSMPWLVCPVNALHAASVLHQFYFGGMGHEMRMQCETCMQCETLVSFDKDGNIHSLCTEGLFRQHGAEAFPFTSNLRGAVFDELYTAGLNCMLEDRISIRTV